MNKPMCSTAVLIASVTLAGAALAQAWPSRPVKVVVAFSAGGTTDILARKVGQELAEKLKQPFVIENKPGTGGNTGTEMVVRAPADGYTLIVNSVGPIAVNPTLYPKLAYNPLTELVPIVQIADVPNVLVVHPSVPAKTFDEFITYAKANPGKLNCSSTGIGTSSHLSCFILVKRAGFEAVHVPYKGADALRDLLAGRVQFMFATIPSVKQHIDSGALRAVAVSSPQRIPALPNVPTVAESGFPGFEADQWYGVVAPAGTPAAVVARLNAEVNKVLLLPEVAQQLAVEGAVAMPTTPQAFGPHTAREIPRWAEVVKAGNVRMD